MAITATSCSTTPKDQAFRHLHAKTANTVEAYRLIQRELAAIEPGQPSIENYSAAFLRAERSIAAIIPVMNDGLKSCSERLMRETFQKESMSASERIHGDAAAGLSGRPIFFINSLEKTVAVVKVFPEGQNSFAKEFWSLTNASLLGISVPKILAIGRCESQGVSRLMLAIDFMVGQSVSDMVAKHLQLAIKSAARDTSLPELGLAFKQLGTLLGRLHTKKAALGKKQTSYEIQFAERMLNGALAAISRHPELGISSDALKRYGMASIKTSQTWLMQHSFIHGDAHLGNFLYDERTQTMSAIDMEDGAYSFGSEPHPLGNPFIDYAKIVASLSVREGFGLHCDEIIALKQALDEGYQSAGAILPSESILNHFWFMEILIYFDWYQRHEKTLPLEAKASMEQIFTMGGDWLKKALADGNFSFARQICKNR